MDELNLSQNTIVVFTSDHGYHMGEHGHWQKTTLFENATRVPLIVAGPGVKNGQRFEYPVEMIDIYPTLTALAGIEPPQSVSGVSLVPALDGSGGVPRKSALSHYMNGYSLRTKRYRYTSWGENGEEGLELYDHETDPQELRNLASSRSMDSVKSELATLLRRRIENAKVPPKGVKQIRQAITRSVPQPFD